MTKKVLVIDDDEGIVDAVSLILEEEGYMVQVSTKADETIEKVEVFKPQVILLDVLMSGKDGREICTQLKEHSEFKKIPIIMISAHPTARESVLACGANDFLSKPFDTQELLDKIALYTSWS